MSTFDNRNNSHYETTEGIMNIERSTMLEPKYIKTIDKVGALSNNTHRATQKSNIWIGS
jgi:hypothetical protein